MQEVNHNSKNPLENPKYLEMMDIYADKYADKAAYEESDITVWTRLMYVAVHAIIILGTLALPQFIDGISKGERIALTLFLGVIAVSLEWFKGTYMERYFIQKMLSVNVKLGKEYRQACHRKMNVNFKILAFFWLISLGLFSTTGVFYAKKYFVSGVEQAYDSSIKSALDAAIASLNKSTQENAGSKALRELNNSVSKAQVSWTNHKADIDAQNGSLRATTEGDQWNYGLMALLACILLEVGLFAARGFHEKKQYEIALSLPNGDTSDAKPKAKAEKTEDEKLALIEKYKLKFAEFAEQNKKFDDINAELINNLNTERRMVATLKSSLADQGKSLPR